MVWSFGGGHGMSLLIHVGIKPLAVWDLIKLCYRTKFADGSVEVTQKICNSQKTKTMDSCIEKGLQ